MTIISPIFEPPSSPRGMAWPYPAQSLIGQNNTESYHNYFSYQRHCILSPCLVRYQPRTTVAQRLLPHADVAVPLRLLMSAYTRKLTKLSLAARASPIRRRQRRCAARANATIFGNSEARFKECTAAVSKADATPIMHGHALAYLPA